MCTLIFPGFPGQVGTLKVWRVVVVRDKEYVLVLVTRGRIDSGKVQRVVVRYRGW